MSLHVTWHRTYPAGMFEDGLHIGGRIVIPRTCWSVETSKAGGPGGQHVNKTESAIRITHLPTGLVVTCQDESSQHKNKDKAMKVLKSRLLDLEVERQNQKRSQARKKMVSTGDRSAKIRTYNYPQGRITDHRINLTLYKLEEILNGNLKEIIDNLKIEDQKLRMSSIDND